MTGPSKTVLIAGHYGFGNLGDETILEAMLHSLRSLRPGTRAIVVSGHPRETEDNHHVEAVSWVDLDGLVRAARASDVMVLGGGGIFHDYWGFDPETLLTPDHAGLSFFCGFAALAGLLDKRLVVYAVGVGPLLSPMGRAYTRLAVDQAWWTTVRDPESKALLESLGADPLRLHLAADPAFGIDPVEGPSMAHGSRPQARGDEDHPLVGVALRSWEIGVSPEDWEGRVAEALDAFLERHGGTALFLPFQSSDELGLDDAETARRVRRRMRHSGRAGVLEGASTRVKMGSVLSRCDLVLGMRLHAVILALRHGVPVVALAYDPKVRQAMAGCGSTEYAIDLEAVTADALAHNLERAYREREGLARRHRESSAALADRAVVSARLLVDLLDAECPDPPRLAPATVELLQRALLNQIRALLERDSAVRSLIAQVEERDRTVRALAEANRAQAEGHHRAVAELQAASRTQVEERDRVIREVQSTMAAQVAERDGIIAELQSSMQTQIAERDRRVMDLQAQVSDRDRSLFEIHTSRHWRLMSAYWATRDGMCAGYRGFRDSLRRLLPYSIRRGVVTAYRRLRPAPKALSGQSVLRPHAPPVVAPQASVPLPDYHVICFPIIDWEFRFQRPQQLVAQFAQNGHPCLYLRTTFHAPGQAARRQRLAAGIEAVEIPGPPGLSIHADAPTPDFIEGALAALGRLRDEDGIREAVCLVQWPFWAPLALAARERWGWKVVYDCLDEHAGFSNVSPAVLEREGELVRQSDLVLATSGALHDKCEPAARRALHLPNAADFDHFHANSRPDPLPHLHGPVIGYYGAIAEWFDSQAVASAARARPDWQFVLVGRTDGAGLAPLRGLGNVHLLGEKPYAELPAYLHRFDVACIPFRNSTLTRATDPVKFYEYLAAGKPVVATGLPELESFRELYHAVRDPSEWVPAIEAALLEDRAASAPARIDFARRNTWADRFQTLAPAVRDLYPKAVIVIVSHDNPAHLRLCLDRLWAATAYPNFEVVVVDNGSGPETTGLLGEAAGREPRLRVIFNEENLGFARANNMGIRAAGEGEVVVLLNDDTVVTGGWLGALIRHLEDPSVGLVGPGTNFAGNEAQVSADYRDLDGLEAFARRMAREHSGRSFDIPMLAMYCVAMRRSLLDRIGLLDERFEVGMFEDDDFSLRVRRAGGRIVCAEDVFIHHVGRASFRRLPPAEYDRLFDENRRRFEAKWGMAWTPHRVRGGG